MLLKFVDWLVYKLWGLDAQTLLAQTINFFIYDSIKILVLLFVMIFVVGFLRTFLPHDKVKAWMERKTGVGYLFAALFGAVTPFCSCSSIPLFLSFIKTGVPLGICFSFLITSPIINEYLVVLMLGFFGVKITVAYVLSGLFIGILSGIILGKLKLEKYLETDIAIEHPSQEESASIESFKARLIFGLHEALAIVRKIWVWVLVGVGIGAVLHNYVPQQMIQAVIAKAGIFSVPIAVLIGVPMYGSCAAIVPIAVVLFEKGIPLGTALAFMMAVSALSLPEAIILRRAMTLRLILIFFAITTMAIIMIGYLFNFLQTILV